MSFPSEPQVIAEGIIDWPRVIPVVVKGRPTYHVPVRCKLCSSERWLDAHTTRSIVRHKPRFTGRCNSCAPLLKRAATLEQYHARGIERQPNGGTIDWTTTRAPSQSGRAYTVLATCKCGVQRWVQTHFAPQRALCASCSLALAIGGDKHPKWKGGHLTGTGYRMIRIPPDHPMIGMAEVSNRLGWGKVLEHRLVAAMVLGRALEAWEQVHHIDGDKLNNAPENLQVVTPDKHSAITALQREVYKLREENARLRSALAGADD